MTPTQPIQSASTATPTRKVIFINRFFYPDLSATSQMLSDLAFFLAGSGFLADSGFLAESGFLAGSGSLTDSEFKICVVTSRQRYETADHDLPARETIDGVHVTRVWTTRFGRGRLLGRAIDYLTFYGSAAWTLWRLARQGDVIVAKTDPPMLSVIAAPIARWRRATLINWLQDVFPEIARALGVGRGRLARGLYWVLAFLRDRSLKTARFNVVLGERMAQRLAQTGARDDTIRIIHNWADGGLIKPIAHVDNPLRQDWQLEDKFVVGYSGNLGRAHDFRAMLDAIAILEDRSAASAQAATAKKTDAAAAESLAQEVPEFLWLFIGGGALYDSFQRQVEDRGLRSVRFQPYQAREQLALSLSAADVHLVSLRPALEGLIVPSKFYGIAAAGRPIVFIGDPDGEIARLIAQHDCGRTVPEGDGAGLAAELLKMASDRAQPRAMGLNARRTFDAEFDKPIAMAHWREILREAREN